MRSSGCAAVGILTNLPTKRAIVSTEGSLFQRQKSCIGLLSRVQVGALTAHKSAFLLWLGRKAPSGKRLTGFSVACGSLRTPFACHPNGVRDSDRYHRRRRRSASSASQKPPLRGGSILRLWRGPSPRACMLWDRVPLRFKVLWLRRGWNPNDSAPKTWK